MPFFLLLFFLLMVIYAILINYYHKAWNQQQEYIPTHQPPSVFISVVIAVRNESTSITGLLNSLNQQSYPKNLYQVILVDDHSTDDTWTVLKNSYYPGLEQTSFQLKEETGKKKAIERAISIARGTLIVTTDADCRFHADWLLTIAGFYESTRAKFIAAPVTIATNRSFLSIFQSLDFLTLQGITAASVYKRFHTMCNGANLAYEKEAFTTVNGFEGIDGIPSGDDMLLMHKIYRQYPNHVLYLKSKSAIVTTAAAESWSAFFHQRIRWASKADRYDDKRIFWVLLLVYLLNLCFLIVVVASFWRNIWLFFGCILLLAKILIEFPFVHAVAVFFGQQKWTKYFPFLQPFHILYTIIAGWLGKFGSYKWKERRIKK
jgi:cellulose synthase/poly-beta-1,6-N-acetylglucosamine synthase-like glycosyltransferase